MIALTLLAVALPLAVPQPPGLTDAAFAFATWAEANGYGLPMTPACYVDENTDVAVCDGQG